MPLNVPLKTAYLTFPDATQMGHCTMMELLLTVRTPASTVTA